MLAYGVLPSNEAAALDEAAALAPAAVGDVLPVAVGQRIGHTLASVPGAGGQPQVDVPVVPGQRGGGADSEQAATSGHVAVGTSSLMNVT